ncbi:MAG TPA: type II toxin-antitoxin system prevent-host-death family antitoxin [Verrucomicrobiae bacterium]|jgi:prevent-host-death family protein|nr:type II toxin-antitoxin system prevent-host-death family antitoxin [Verrucomicrobiae bacterium]
MAMSGHKKQFVGISVGIKELKDRASEIIATVQRTGRAVSITKNNQEVARIMPIPANPRERLVAAGLVKPGSKPRPLGDLKLSEMNGDASVAIGAIIADRDDR